ncbi:hypothetical protein Bbelb_258480 [Branchiostoma belcheri]|nr:hypothetical protein Bbelb_258480 [Branchiostoma belcheri]
MLVIVVTTHRVYFATLQAELTTSQPWPNLPPTPDLFPTMVGGEFGSVRERYRPLGYSGHFGRYGEGVQGQRLRIPYKGWRRNSEPLTLPWEDARVPPGPELGVAMATKRLSSIPGQCEVTPSSDYSLDYTMQQL